MDLHVDVLILGGGIAGAGLAFNLRRLGYAGRVVVLESKSTGSAAAYGYRNTLEETVREYGLPYDKVFAGLRDGITLKSKTHQLHWCDVDIPCYFFDYQKACQYLLEQSDAELISGTAEKLFPEKKQLHSDSGHFHYGILVDCTGPAFFGRKALGLPLPKKYYVGRTFSIPWVHTQNPPSWFTSDRFIYYSEITGYMEDAYLIGNRLLYGMWDYSSDPNTEVLTKKGCILEDLGVASEHPGFKVCIPAEPVFPLVFGSIVFLGDSTGLATPASSEGTRPHLESSKLLAQTITNGQDLTRFENLWCKKQLWSYCFHKSFKDDLKEYNDFFHRIRNYPEVYRDLILNRNRSLPMKALIPSLPYLILVLIRCLWIYGTAIKAMKTKNPKKPPHAINN